MKPPRMTLASVGFLVLLCAVDLVIIRASLYRNGPELWPAAVPFLLPMVNLLVVVGYRTIWPEGRTPGALGFLVAGFLATAVEFGVTRLAADSVFEGFIWLFRPLALRTRGHVAARLAGSVMAQSVAKSVLDASFPIVFFCTLPLLSALLGGWAARRLLPPGPRRIS
jgi:hypothetical protein